MSVVAGTANQWSVGWWVRGIFTIAALTIFAAILGCTRNNEEKTIPLEWVTAARAATIGEMEKALGDPNDRASEKQFLNWTSPHSGGGVKILKVLCRDVCAASEAPSEVLYFYLPSEGGRPKHVVRLDTPR
ncbi:hypothetical protein MI467_06515 [Delftia acidovorans]|uniref:hypothetical protein n=1 Tax=Delftia acidovorans TaxID=80866 RepID=UPI001EFE91BC|nr:hypothetical protein [Delftia acidovorans]MCG8986493.1 hypothetical protein [Delftia acidovorans]